MSRDSIPADATRLAYTARGSGRWDHAASPEVVDVVKRTPQQITIRTSNGSLKKFWAKDGSEIGGRSSVEVVTSAIMDSIQRTRYRGAIQSTCYKIEEAARSLAHNADLQKVKLSDLQVIQRAAKELLAQIGDWERTAAKAAGKDVGKDDGDDPSTD